MSFLLKTFECKIIEKSSRLQLLVILKHAYKLFTKKNQPIRCLTRQK